MTRGTARFAVPAIFLCSLLFLIWLGSESDHFPAYTATGDYYDLLAEGLRDGHLYLPVTGAYHLDAAEFHGHTYLYYGVVPALLAFLPYRCVTGHNLPPHLAVTLFVLIGFGFSVRLWLAATRRFRDRLPASLVLAVIPMLGCASGTTFLLTRAKFYEVPIAAAYACGMAALLFLYRALFGPTAPGRALAAASVALGLAVGCRPNYLLCLPLLPLAAAMAVRWREPGRAIAWATASLLPAAVVGLGLAFYNFARFGSIIEFGFKYGQNEFFAHHVPLLAWSYVPTNLHWYYLTPPWLSPFFPYVYPENASFLPGGYPTDEAIHGQAVVFLFAAFIGLTALVLRRKTKPGPHSLFLVFPGWMFVSALGCMCVLGIRANRYMVDFQPALVVGCCLVALGVSRKLAGSAGKIWRGLLVLFAWASVLDNVGGALQQFEEFGNTHPATWARLSRWGDRPASWVRRLGGYAYGPVKLRIVFPAAPAQTTFQPIFTLGAPYFDDGLYVMQTPQNRIEFLTDHHGYGGLHSSLQPITPGQPYDLEVRMGAFYPPPAEPFYGYLSPRERQLLRLQTEVTFDGQPVISGLAPAYEDPPGSLEWGRNNITFNGYSRRFTGRILSVQRLPAELHPPTVSVTGFWRLQIAFPPPDHPGHYPILATGVAGAGNLLLVSRLPDGSIAFSLDTWGSGLQTSPAIAAPAAGAHRLEVCAGPAAAHHPWPEGWQIDPLALRDLDHVLLVWLDGQLVFRAHIDLFPDSFQHAQIGSNAQGFSSAVGLYLGDLAEQAYAPDELKAALQRNLALATGQEKHK